LSYTRPGSPPTAALYSGQKTLSDVRSDATEQAVYDAAQALFGMAQYPVIEVLYRKNFELVEE
jgi:hypothetical protein